MQCQSARHVLCASLARRRLTQQEQVPRSRTSQLHRELLLEGQPLTEAWSTLDKLNLIEGKDRHHTGGGGFVAGLTLGRLDAAVGAGTDDEGSPNVQSTLKVYGNEEGGGQGVSDYALFWRDKLRVGVSTTRQRDAFLLTMSS